MTSYPLYMMSPTLCVWLHKLYICLETRYNCHHTRCICHHTHLSVEDITPTMWDIRGGICMPSYALHMASYPHFMTVLSIYEIKCTVLMTSNALYMTCHLLCIISHSLHVWHHTMPVSMTSHTLCLWHIHFIWHHTQCYDNTATMSDITPSVSVSSYAMYQFYQTQCMYDITATIYITMYAPHMTTHPHFMTSHDFIYDMKPTTSDITSTIPDLTSIVSVSSHPHYRWYHSHSMYDITSSICVTSYLPDLRHHILYMTSQHCVLMTPH